MNRLLSIASGWMTATGAGAVIISAVRGYMSGELKAEEALFQGGLGVIAIGLRRAIQRLLKKDDVKPDQI